MALENPNKRTPMTMNLGDNFDLNQSQNGQNTGITGVGTETDTERLEKLLNDQQGFFERLFGSRDPKQKAYQAGVTHGDNMIARANDLLANHEAEITDLMTQVQEAVEQGQYGKADRLKNKIRRRSAKHERQQKKPPGTGANFDFVGAGIAAAQEAPNIYRNLSTLPTSKKEALGQGISTAASAANIALAGGAGLAIAAPVALGGYMASQAFNVGWQDELRRELEKEAVKRYNEGQQEVDDTAIAQADSERIQAYMNLMRRTQGYSDIG